MNIKHNSATATIESLSHDGRGITHIEGKTIFVDDALTGEIVTFRYTKRRSKFSEAKAIAINNPAKERVPARCEYFGICGGCSLQHMQSQRQLSLKQNTLLEQLRHMAGVQPEHVLPPLTGPLFKYRHKARLGVKYVVKKNSVLVGFRERQSPFLVDMNACSILADPVGELIAPLRKLIASLHSYTKIAQIEVAIGDHNTALIFRHLEPLDQHDTNKLVSFAEQTKIRIYLQPGGPDTIHLLSPIGGDELLCYCLPDQGMELFFHPAHFSQVNPKLNRRMVNHALQLLDPKPEDKILDLFCGIGNFSLPIAKYCHHVIGVEGEQAMVEAALHNASHNNITNVSFHSYDLTKDINLAPFTNEKYDKLLLDPPRSGAKEILQKLAQFNFRRIVYVSCNPATLARDAGILVKDFNYRLVSAGIIDMFPHTKHVESIALFELD